MFRYFLFKTLIFRANCLKKFKLIQAGRFFLEKLFYGIVRGFIQVLNRRAIEFDNRAKNLQGPPGLAF